MQTMLNEVVSKQDNSDLALKRGLFYVLLVTTRSNFFNKAHIIPNIKIQQVLTYILQK